MVSTNEKMAHTQFLRYQLHSLHGQLWSLPGGNPNQWHKLLDQYVIATAELYKTLSE
jgi:DNA-binding ferritin-like protein